MRILILGGGELAARLAQSVRFQGAGQSHDVKVVSKAECDLTDYMAVVRLIDADKPDFVVCTAGLSDRRIGVSLREVIEANLITAMNVGTAAHAHKVPCILTASTAGISPGGHRWYGPAKAGVINFVRAMANTEARIWAVSPGRMSTGMRQDDFPGEDRRTQLDPGFVARVMIDIMEGMYAPGANVIVRKVGYSRVDVYEKVGACLPSLL